MVNSWMEDLSPNSNYHSITKQSGKWTEKENKLFETMLATVDISTPDIWEKMAEFLPGKSVSEVMSHYKTLEEDVNHIEVRLIHVPGYSSSSFSIRSDGTEQSCSCVKGKGGKFHNSGRKKGVPWTEEEHSMRAFLPSAATKGKRYSLPNSRIMIHQPWRHSRWTNWHQYINAGNANQVSDGGGSVLLMKRSVAMQKGLPAIGIFRYAKSIMSKRGRS